MSSAPTPGLVPDPEREARLAAIRARIAGLDEARHLAQERARRQGKKAGGRISFARNWWGRAWIDALEHRARLDPNRLPRGRTYARTGKVGALVVEQGEVRAPVYGSRMSAYRVRVRVRMFTDEEWARALEAVAAKAGHAAALLDGELTPAVVEDLSGVGLELLPGPGEVGTSCTCPDWANPCKHAAAVCYLIAKLLDRDPFALLVLRGRERDEVLTGLRTRRQSPDALELASSSPRTEMTMPARSLLLGRVPGPLPRPPRPPAAPGRPAPLVVDPPPHLGVRAAGLSALASDAAARALELLNGESRGGLDLTFEQDLARRASSLVGTTRFSTLAKRAGWDPKHLMRLALAWRHAGMAGLAVLEERWDPPAGALDEGRQALIEAGLAARPRASSNAVSAGGVQLRLGQDGLWYRLERRAGGWDLVAPASVDPASLVSLR